VAVPAPAVQFVGRAVRRSGMVDFSPEQMQFLNFGRVVSNDRLKREFGYNPQYSTAAAFSEFLTGWPVRPVVSESVLDAGGAVLARLLRTTPPPASRTPASVTRIGSSGRLRHG
ncbi:MAG TPA: hypothetical protein VLJ82_07285, partial [Jatrophihabitans sp.]|nr:hypothetical protein [Jatrophihabitans sp.]